jgi:hypothetical protein
MTLELQDRARVRAAAPYEVLHVTRSFFAEPTLTQQLELPVHVREVPLPEAMVHPGHPDLVWASSADPTDVSLLRAVFPDASLLVSVDRGAQPTYIIDLYERGADLVVTDEGVRHAAAAARSLLRRRRQLTGNIQPMEPA